MKRGIRYIFLALAVFALLSIGNIWAWNKNRDLIAYCCPHPVRDYAGAYLVYKCKSDSLFLHKYYIKHPYQYLYWHRYVQSSDYTISRDNGEKLIHPGRIAVHVAGSTSIYDRDRFINFNYMPKFIISGADTLHPSGRPVHSGHSGHVRLTAGPLFNREAW